MSSVVVFVSVTFFCRGTEPTTIPDVCVCACVCLFSDYGARASAKTTLTEFAEILGGGSDRYLSLSDHSDFAAKRHIAAERRRSTRIKRRLVVRSIPKAAQRRMAVRSMPKDTGA